VVLDTITTSPKIMIDLTVLLVLLASIDQGGIMAVLAIVANLIIIDIKRKSLL
jgi:hypothetical protein